MKNILMGNQQEIQSYIAGLFDAEGWFSFGRSQKKYWNPVIGFINTNANIIDQYIDFLRENGIKFYLTIRRRKSWHKIQTSVMISGDPQIKKWLGLIQPNLVIKRHQAEIILESLGKKPRIRESCKKSFQESLEQEEVTTENTNEFWLMGLWEGDGSALIIRRQYRNRRNPILIPKILFFTTSQTGKNSIGNFLKIENIPHHIQRFDKDRNKPKYVISMLGLKRCSKFCKRFGKLDLNGKIAIIGRFCEHRLSLPRSQPYSDLDIYNYNRLKILNGHTSDRLSG